MSSKKEKTEDATKDVKVIDPLSAQEAGEDLPSTFETSADEQLVPTQGTSAPVERSDLITPKLHLVQKTGDMSVQFTQGSWVLNKEIQLTQDVQEDLDIVVLERPFKFFMEHLPYDPAGPRPRFFHTAEELNEAGLTLEWDNTNNVRATADRAARVLLLILKPDSVEAEQGFSMEVDGLGACALASWLLVNTAYRAAARRLFTAEMLDLNGKPYHSRMWKLRSIITKSGGFTIFAPQLTLGKWLTDEVAESVKTRMGS